MPVVQALKENLPIVTAYSHIDLKPGAQVIW